jgi:hypothetical protein
MFPEFYLFSSFYKEDLKKKRVTTHEKLDDSECEEKLYKLNATQHHQHKISII